MAVTVDIVLFGISKHAPSVLLIKRGNEPFKDCWALPGGYVDMGEKIEAAAIRELSEETGVRSIGLNFLGFFDDVERDPRERTVSFAYWSSIKMEHQNIMAADDASAAQWHALAQLPHLAFDHNEIIDRAISEFQAAKS